jgi:glucose/arabinose dehydrogenase
MAQGPAPSRATLAPGLVLAVVSSLLVGCGASPPSSPAGTRAEGGPSSLASPAAGDPHSLRLALTTVASGLQAPLFVTGAGDGSGRLFVVEQAGRIRIVRGDRLLATPFLDIRDRVSAGGERGLLGLAFLPGSDGRVFFLDYTDRAGDTVISRVRVSATDPDRADPTSETVLLRIPQPFPNHNGGMLAFGPEGDLFVGVGDGGSAGDPLDNGQRLDTLLGKLLRLQVGADGPARIPTDNPFVRRPGVRPEIWALGLRNPWRFSVDRATGQLWIGDVGQNAWEEIDRAPNLTGAGANYGWRRMEGAHCYPPGTTCDPTAFVPPIAEYGHDQGCAVTGGYVYRGARWPALQGVYLFGDYCSGRIWGLASDGPAPQDPVLLLQDQLAISSFGQDDAGELYVTDLAAGRIEALQGTPR